MSEINTMHGIQFGGACFEEVPESSMLRSGIDIAHLMTEGTEKTEFVAKLAKRWEVEANMLAWSISEKIGKA